MVSTNTENCVFGEQNFINSFDVCLLLEIIATILFHTLMDCGYMTFYNSTTYTGYRGNHGLHEGNRNMDLCLRRVTLYRF